MRKRVLAAWVVLGVPVLALLYLYISNILLGQSYGRWMIAFDRGDDVSAKALAERTYRYDALESRYLRAQVSIAESLKHGHADRARMLASSLKAMNAAWGFNFFVRSEARYPVKITKAYLYTFVGDRKKGLSLFEASCRENPDYGFDVKACVNSTSYVGPMGSRLSALKLYERVYLRRNFRSGSSVVDDLYEAVALKYLNMPGARALVSKLKSENKFDKKFQGIYCDDPNPVDKINCPD